MEADAAMAPAWNAPADKGGVNGSLFCLPIHLLSPPAAEQLIE